MEKSDIDWVADTLRKRNTQWTPLIVNKLVRILEELFSQIPRESVRDTGIADERDRAQLWLVAIHSDKEVQPNWLFDNQSIPPFPLTDEEFLGLAVSIERITQAFKEITTALPSIFVSHSNDDNAWCEKLVYTFQESGCDV